MYETIIVGQYCKYVIVLMAYCILIIVPAWFLEKHLPYFAFAPKFPWRARPLTTLDDTLYPCPSSWQTPFCPLWGIFLETSLTSWVLAKRIVQYVTVLSTSIMYYHVTKGDYWMKEIISFHCSLVKLSRRLLTLHWRKPLPLERSVMMSLYHQLPYN